MDNKKQDTVFLPIEQLNFSLLSSDEVKRLSVVNINSSHLSGQGSVYDARLGVIENNSICVTCGLDNNKCVGHFGHIELCVPVIHPLYCSETQAYLNCFCDTCYSLLLTADQLKLLKLLTFKGMERFQQICDFIRAKVKTCPKCKQDRSSFLVKEGKVIKYWGDKPTRNNSMEVPVEDVETLFKSVSQETVVMMGFDNPNVHPLSLVIRNFPVLPLCARPFVETGKGTCDDDLTTKYIEIVKTNNKLKKTSKKNERDELVASLEFHILTLMNNSKKKARQSNNRPIKCLKERLNGKQGRFRNNLSGKRIDFSARTVIGPEPCCKVDEIVIPQEFATHITFPERCCKYNKEYLQNLVDTGKANSIIRNEIVRNLKFHNHVRAFIQEGDFTFEAGDVVVRETMVQKNGVNSKVQKKFDPFKVFSATGKEFELGPADIVVRNGKVIKPPSRQKFTLSLGDKVVRKNKILDPEKIRIEKGEFEFEMDDKILRHGRELSVKFTRNTSPQVLEGDIVERHLKNGDIVLFGRQPTQ
jgi:DNA-directed RNA polymerase, beta'' subunit/160 kD subunit